MVNKQKPSETVTVVVEIRTKGFPVSVIAFKHSKTTFINGEDKLRLVEGIHSTIRGFDSLQKL